MKNIIHCVHKPQKIKEIDKVGYFASDMLNALDFKGDAMVNFTRISDIPSAATIPQLAQHIEITFEEIMVPWPDFGVPRVKISFWKALHSYVMERGWKSVCFHCQAGHGRTGTALAAMLIANEGYSAQDAVWQIRSSYCVEAVESIEQSMYLQKVDEYYNKRELDPDAISVPSTWFHTDDDDKRKDKK